MNGNVPHIYWDACIFLYCLDEHSQWQPILDPLLDNAKDGKIIIYTSVVSQVEVAYTAAEMKSSILDADEEARIEALWKRKGVIVVDFNPFIAGLARNILRDSMAKKRARSGVNTADIIHFATAQYIQADEIHTTETALHKYGNDLGLGFVVKEPTTPMQRLSGV